MSAMDDLFNTAHLLSPEAAIRLLTTNPQSQVAIVGLLRGMLAQWEAKKVLLDPIQTEVILNSLVEILVGVFEGSSRAIGEVTHSVFTAGFRAGVESAQAR